MASKLTTCFLCWNLTAFNCNHRNAAAPVVRFPFPPASCKMRHRALRYIHPFLFFHCNFHLLGAIIDWFYRVAVLRIRNNNKSRNHSLLLPIRINKMTLSLTRLHLLVMLVAVCRTWTLRMMMMMMILMLLTIPWLWYLLHLTKTTFYICLLLHKCNLLFLFIEWIIVKLVIEIMFKFPECRFNYQIRSWCCCVSLVKLWEELIWAYPVI